MTLKVIDNQYGGPEKKHFLGALYG